MGFKRNVIIPIDYDFIEQKITSRNYWKRNITGFYLIIILNFLMNIKVYLSD